MPLGRIGLEGNRTSYPLKCLSGNSGITSSFLVTGLSTSFALRIPNTGISFRAPVPCFRVRRLLKKALSIPIASPLTRLFPS